MNPHIGLIVTGTNTVKDLQVFIRTLEIWHPKAHLYIFTDSATSINIPFKGTLHKKVALDAYSGKNRQEMEALPGKIYKTLWTDFMYEKANVLEYMFSFTPTLKEQGAWFLDADITFLAPLPHIPPTATVALSPHYLREVDEKNYGKYNGGFLWMKDPDLLTCWRTAGHGARFYEQSALEELALKASQTLYEFPIQVNFGWWRMFQSIESPQAIATKFKLYRPDTSIGIRYDNLPLQSIHTHWHQKDSSATGAFNTWFTKFITHYKVHPPISKFIQHLQTL